MWRRVPTVVPPPAVPAQTRHDEGSLDSLDSLHTSKSMESLDSLTPYKSPVGKGGTGSSAGGGGGGIRSLLGRTTSIKKRFSSPRKLFGSASLPGMPHHPPSGVSRGERPASLSPSSPPATTKDGDENEVGMQDTAPTNFVNSSTTASSESGGGAKLPDRSFVPEYDDDDDDGGSKSALSGESRDGTSSYEEFLIVITSEDDLVSSFIPKEGSTLINSDDDGAHDAIEEEEEREYDDHGGNDDCRCLWLCPEPFLNVMRGSNGKHTSAVIPLPKPH
ncbi:hypothetical protein ACHAXA_008968 [Cyclostephanos tholiformis]|uniref:Uncharacterized protein n=1 Tax=Cyclostephanos tholiformis TaxID=382380 RepID=A0ABD3SC07_9STRA